MDVNKFEILQSITTSVGITTQCPILALTTADIDNNRNLRTLEKL